MKAVILAAGRGSRISAISGGRPKSLLKVAGVPIIERIIRAAQTAGIEEFVIVTGFQPQEIPNLLGDGTRLGVRIQYVHNDRWEDLANGHSLFVAKEFLSDPFVILMSDHVFSPEALKRLLNEPVPPKGCVLLTDRDTTNVSGCIDLDDATKVRTDENGKIVAMGKTLQDFDRIDTGIFLATHGLIEAYERAFARGESSLTASNNELTANGLMRECPVNASDFPWFDLDTPRCYRQYVEYLRHSLYKSHDGIVSIYCNRPISSRVSFLISKLPITPNMISFALFLASIGILPLLARGSWILGGIGIHAVSVLDGVDGEIARLKFQSSPFGAWLDWIVDRIIDVAFLAAIGIGMEFSVSGRGIGLAAVAIAASIFFWLSQDLIVITGKFRPKLKPAASTRRFVLNFRRDIFLGIVTILLLFEMPEAALLATILTRGPYAAWRTAAA